MPDKSADVRAQIGHARAELAARLSARQATFAGLDGRHQAVGYTRAGVAVAFIAMIVALLLERAPFSGWWLLSPIPVLVLLGYWLDRLDAALAAVSRSIRFYERAIARIDGTWPGTGPSGARFLDEHHIYASDLDLFGRGSLFDLIGSARTPMGEETLAAWLLAAAAPDIVRARQAAVEELSSRLDFLERLATTSPETGGRISQTSLATWASQPLELQSSGWRATAWVLSCLGVGAIVAISTYLTAINGIVALTASTLDLLLAYSIPVVIVLALVYRRFKRDAERILGRAESATEHLHVIERALQIIEAETFQTARLSTLRAGLVTSGHPASWWIARLQRIRNIADSRRNWFVKVTGPLLLFDFHMAGFLEDWRGATRATIATWLDAVGEVEALASLAGYRFNRPHHIFPEFVEARAAQFEATGLGHPLLHSTTGVVTNDVAFVPPLQTLIVSGSNMSGKSTLLRTIGINVVLAQAGGPVYAQRMRLSALAVGTSIRVQDSLQEGVSRFYAEISRLKQIMDTAGKGQPLLFLIDEFLHGTNSHDRFHGAAAIVRGLVDRGAIGLITTHDLALTQIAEELGVRAANVHFQDEMKDGRLSFDYIMRSGIVTRSNAIELMRSVGLDV